MREQDSRDDCRLLLRPDLAVTFDNRRKIEISTTRPSPRMEAPLIRSVATLWSSSALMTSSSSPSQTVHNQAQLAFANGNDQHKNFVGARFRFRAGATSQSHHGKNRLRSCRTS